MAAAIQNGAGVVQVPYKILISKIVDVLTVKDISAWTRKQ